MNDKVVVLKMPGISVTLLDNVAYELRTSRSEILRRLATAWLADPEAQERMKVDLASERQAQLASAGRRTASRKKGESGEAVEPVYELAWLRSKLVLLMPEVASMSDDEVMTLSRRGDVPIALASAWKHEQAQASDK